jgi:NADH:ubiquinone oxidoreductase subunit F (NADH-binding)/(2Fe-2S) ferredoxin/Pyruvate/2-oxoacid:ferredoxin oxidoreductase delta subunit
MPRISSIAELEELHRVIAAERSGQRATIGLCGGTGCLSAESPKVNEAFRAEILKRGLGNQVELRLTGCRGFCEGGPVVEIRPEETFYVRVKPEDAGEILEGILAGKPVERLLYVHPVTKEAIAKTNEIPFYKKQKRLVFRHSGLVDPTNIRDYMALGGYGALAKALRNMTPEQVIAEIESSGLRGRGGGGFPTGRKWRSTREVPGAVKYVICNADEGDPGAFMDRSLLEGDPHCVIEGMIIGAFAIGAGNGVVYVRQEYPLAVKNLTVALQQAREYGFLGKDILGSGFDFDIRISRGGGAFVCGESSALIASVEGKPGEPRAKHVHMAESGLWEKPTCLNNVETWGNVPLIIERGAGWYSGIGTKKSTGTKVFSLVGKIQNTGLVEVPMGVSLREMIFDIGGGIPGGKRFKAVQTGGPSGGCLPESALDLLVDFDSLTDAGAMMGSGGMIVMDQDTCMVDVARYFLHFLRDESCGKCTACREGLDVMYQIVSDVCAGKGREEHIAQLEELSEAVRDASMCALGTTSVNPVLSTLRYFRAEYEAHIKEHRCPAGVCKALISYRIDPEKCTACLLCKKNCPSAAITGEKKKPQSIEQEKCIKCGTCREVCKSEAVVVQ